jgi:hypothetical protein
MSHVLPARLDCIVAEPGLGTAPSTSDSAAAAINANPLSDLIAPLSRVPVRSLPIQESRFAHVRRKAKRVARNTITGA